MSPGQCATHAGLKIHGCKSGSAPAALSGLCAKTDLEFIHALDGNKLKRR